MKEVINTLNVIVLIFVLVVLAVFTEPTRAYSQNQNQNKTFDAHTYCNNIAEFGSTIMEHRQNGASMSKAMHTVETNPTFEPVRDIAKALIYDAYKEPLFDYAQEKRNAVLEFENYIYMICRETVTKEGY